jgi:hypothetical protein
LGPHSSATSCGPIRPVGRRPPGACELAPGRPGSACQRSRCCVDCSPCPTPTALLACARCTPDAPPPKNVINQFSQTCADPRVAYFGNVSVGADVSLAELRGLYHAVRPPHTSLEAGEGGLGGRCGWRQSQRAQSSQSIGRSAPCPLAQDNRDATWARPLCCHPHATLNHPQVVLAYGAESDRPLNVPGEASARVYSAREFVWWYNAHPDAAALPVDLSEVETVAICGIGNVALDCARVLLRRPAELAKTDIAAHAMAQLAGSSRVRRVHIFARRGPVQVRGGPLAGWGG